MNTGCFKCDKAQWDADGCTCEITGLLVGNAERGCEYRKDTELKPCPFCGGEAKIEKHVCAVYVVCTKCHAQSAVSTAMIEKCALDVVTKAWNNRVSDVISRKEVIELIESFKMGSTHELSKSDFDRNDTLRLLQDVIKRVTWEDVL